MWDEVFYLNVSLTHLNTVLKEEPNLTVSQRLSSVFQLMLKYVLIVWKNYFHKCKTIISWLLLVRKGDDCILYIFGHQVECIQGDHSSYCCSLVYSCFLYKCFFRAESEFSTEMVLFLNSFFPKKKKKVSNHLPITKQAHCSMPD